MESVTVYVVVVAAHVVATLVVVDLSMSGASTEPKSLSKLELLPLVGDLIIIGYAVRFRGGLM